MPKIPILKPRQVVRILEKAGFKFVRQKGSHRIYVKERVGVTLPYHNKDLRRGTLKAIIKQSRMTVEEFLQFLL